MCYLWSKTVLYMVAVPPRLRCVISQKLCKECISKYSKCDCGHILRTCSCPVAWSVFVWTHKVSQTLSVIFVWHVDLCTQEVFSNPHADDFPLTICFVTLWLHPRCLSLINTQSKLKLKRQLKPSEGLKPQPPNAFQPFCFIGFHVWLFFTNF